MSLDSNHVYGLLAVLLGVLAVFGRTVRLGTSVAWYKTINGGIAVEIGIGLILMGAWLLTAP
jgi:hypothetical protein